MAIDLKTETIIPVKKVPDLMALTYDASRGLRLVSHRHIGPKAKVAVPALVEALKDKDRDVREQAAGTQSGETRLADGKSAPSPVRADVGIAAPLTTMTVFHRD